MRMPEHEAFMGEALKLASYAARLGETPVGAVVVKDGVIIGRGFNRRELFHSPLEHAEINALHDASAHLGAWRLLGATLYSTLEPCIMCAGALLHARVPKLIYGACDKKFGAIESLYAIGHDARLNHRIDSVGGVRAQESIDLLQSFFRELRKSKENP